VHLSASDLDVATAILYVDDGYVFVAREIGSLVACLTHVWHCPAYVELCLLSTACRTSLQLLYVAWPEFCMHTLHICCNFEAAAAAAQLQNFLQQCAIQEGLVPLPRAGQEGVLQGCVGHSQCLESVPCSLSVYHAGSCCW
jgi:hypothetical protein